MQSAFEIGKTPVVSVGELNSLIKSVLEGLPVLKRITVCGEISNIKIQQHIYFTLKDSRGAISAVMFRSDAESLKFRPQNGMQIKATGHIGVYTKSGTYQLYCENIEQDGVGALYIAYEQLKTRLGAEGLFDKAHKKPLPKIPRRVGIVTAPTGAAIRDMIDVMGRRFPFAEILIYPSQVQGVSAPAQLTKALTALDAKGDCDVIIIGRGGGSIEDLWAFNDEQLARAVYACNTPVISAVGHETDFTICDFVADMRAPTPSAAAEITVPDKNELLNKFKNLQNRFALLAGNRISAESDRLKRSAERPVLKDPLAAFDEKRVYTDKLAAQLESAVMTRLDRLGSSFGTMSNRLTSAAETSVTALAHKTELAKSRLDMLSPLAVLDRGYAAVFTDDGSVASASDLKPGDRISVRFADGTAHAITERVDKTK